MSKDMGASSQSEDRAVVNGAGQAVSALRASVPSAGICAFDLDECTVTIAFDSEAEVRTFLDGLPGRKRIWCDAERELSTAETRVSVLRHYAQGIEAGTGETREAGLDAKHESPVAKPCAPTSSSRQPRGPVMQQGASTQELLPVIQAGVAWLRDLAGTCKGTASNLYRDDESDEAAEEWRVRGESYAFIADQIERGHSPFTELATTPKPTEPAGVAGLADEAETAFWQWWNTERKPDEHEAASFRAGFRAALRTPPLLEVAKEALEYTLKSLGDPVPISRRHVARKILAALQTIGAGQ